MMLYWNSKIIVPAKKLWVGFLLTMISLYPVWPNWFNPTLPETGEKTRYVLLGEWFADSMAAGNWFPRWLPDLNGGYGYPEFVFYQPGYFFLNALTAQLTGDFLLRQLLTLSLVAIAGGCGVYCLMRCYVRPCYALLMVAVFQIAPYVHINLYVRGDLSEWMALQLTPWPVFFLQRLVVQSPDSPGRRLLSWLGLSFSTAVVCYTHPVGVMFLPPLLLFIGGVVLKIDPTLSSEKRLFRSRDLLTSLAMALAISAPYWMTVILMKPYVNIQSAFEGGYQAWRNTAGFVEMSVGSLLHKNATEFLGAPFMLFALAGALAGKRLPLISGAGLAYLAIVLAISPLGRPLWEIPPFSFMQFPWRLACFAPLLQVICFAGFFSIRFSRQIVRNATLATAVVILAAWSHGHYGFEPHEPFGAPLTQNDFTCMKGFARIALPGSFLRTLDARELLPHTAWQSRLLPARGTWTVPDECNGLKEHFYGYSQLSFPRPLVEASQPGWQALPGTKNSPYHIDYTLSGTTAADIVINQIYLPGWIILVNEKPVSRTYVENNVKPDGRMHLQLQPGHWRIQAWYDAPPGHRSITMIIVLAFMLSLLYWLRQWRRQTES